MTDFTTFPIPAKKLSELPVVTELDGTEYLVGVKNGITSRFPVSLFVSPPEGAAFTITRTGSVTGAFLANIVGLNPSGATARGWSIPAATSDTADPAASTVNGQNVVAYMLLEQDAFPSPNPFHVFVFVEGIHPQEFITGVIDPDLGALLAGAADIYGINDGSDSTAITFPSTYWGWSAGSSEAALTQWLTAASIDVEVTA